MAILGLARGPDPLSFAAQQKSSHSLSKYELLAETNNQLKIKIQQLEGLLGSSSTEKEAAMKQVTSLTEQDNQVNKIFQSTKVELQSVIAKLEEQVTLERSKPNTLVSEIEKLKEVAAEKSVLESHVEELEKTLKKFEAQLKEEVKNATAASKELQAAQISIAEQKQAKSQKHSELEAALKQSQELKKYNSPVFLNPSTHNHINRASRKHRPATVQLVLLTYPCFLLCLVKSQYPDVFTFYLDHGTLALRS
ncbi:hypothetical protein F2Q70_00036792 [Brassica cretica]|uniref:Uncharacterized protein n=1 Tax=Brassica cretica TaxID=69181 RepID=A0A8S9JQL6_BRACR|nr:hypothetical protein F2Q68_00032096 [Brassica cretica]KAF2583922.1 hypothetical protein F2Q70_00036792 [Brassica cretica]